MYDVGLKIEVTELAKSLEEMYKIDFMPTQQYPYDAGYDVRACITEHVIIAPGETKMVPIGLIFELDDPHWEIQFRSRSGLAAKYGIHVLNSPGTIDYLYREQAQAILHNAGQKVFVVSPGDRVGQICIRRVPSVKFERVERVEKTARSGFGSTGVK